MLALAEGVGDEGMAQQIKKKIAGLEKDKSKEEKKDEKNPKQARARFNEAAQFEMSCQAKVEAAERHLQSLREQMSQAQSVLDERQSEMEIAKRLKGECYEALKKIEEPDEEPKVDAEGYEKVPVRRAAKNLGDILKLDPGDVMGEIVGTKSCSSAGSKSALL
eukprot:12663626-Alexandrium_andersonii.AAC.1